MNPSSPRTITTRALPAAAIAAALLLAACSDDGEPTVTGSPSQTDGAPASQSTASSTSAPTDEGTSAGSATSPADTAGGTGGVTMESIAFMPQEITVEAGTTVTWSNEDSVAHTVTAREGGASFDSGNMDAGTTFETTFDEPGTYEYVCDYHVGSGMTGTIVVE